MGKPIIFKESKNTNKDLEKLKKENKIWKVIDIYERQLTELFEISNPHLINSRSFKQKQKDYVKKRMKGNKNFLGNWIYFPWNGVLLHSVKENELFQLKTNRNKNLITDVEQKRLYDSCIGILGLSVGSGLAIGLSYQGIAKKLKLAEFDNLETTNLNRIPAGLYQIGMKKIEIAMQKIYEINPYAEIHPFDKGLTKEYLSEFVHSNPKPRVIFEIIDDFEMKVLVRMEARKAGIPVITFANLGDSLLADVDRYDLDKNLPFFNGLLGDFPEEILDKPDEDKNKYAVKMVGIENVPPRAMESVKEIGKSLVGRPQLSSTVAMSAALGVFVTRKIILDENLPSGRSKVTFENFFK